MEKPYLLADMPDPALNVKVPPQPTPSPKKKTLIKTLSKLALSAGLIFWILRGADIGEIGAAFKKTNIAILILAVFLQFFGIVISSMRWRLLLRICGSNASLWFLFKSYLVSGFFNNLLPSTIGGDAYRAYDSCRLGQSMSNAVSIILVDRFIGLMVLVLFSVTALMFTHVLADFLPHLTVYTAAGLIAMLCLVWLFISPPKRLGSIFSGMHSQLGQKLHVLSQALLAFRHHRAVLAKCLEWSVLLQANVVLHYWLTALALGLPIDLLNFFLIAPLGILITMLPISINGIGIREYVYIQFLGAFGVTAPQALAFVWIVYGLIVLQGIVGGIVYVLHR